MRAKRLTGSTITITAVAVVLAGCGGSAEIRTVPPASSVPAPVAATIAATTIATPPSAPPPVVTAPAPVTVTVTTSAAPPPPAPAAPSGRPVVSPARYARDTANAFRALTEFSNTLRSIASPAQFRSSLRSLRADLRQFDGAIRRLRAYRLEDARLNAQRSRLARLGPPLARSMSNFLDAIRDGDTTRARRLAGEIQSRLNAFRDAV